VAARTLQEHLDAAGPKRILALDGGGVRGVLTLEYLARIEQLLRARADRPDAFRLSDYFDLIGGTSTGSIIATGLALGLSVAELQDLYSRLAAGVFEKPAFRFGIFVPKFARATLVDALKAHFGDETLGSSRIRTGLMIMTKRLDTGSPWPIHNNPRGRYYDAAPGSTALPNKDFPLWQIVRASAAAPHYFEPERVRVSEEGGRFVDGAFVDGGVSPFNNPSLQLLMLATLSGYGFNWSPGSERLLLVSAGTGSATMRMTADAVIGMSAVEQAARALAALMDDCDALVQTMMQWLSASRTPWTIDSEIGDLAADMFGRTKWLTYLRYNVILQSAWLKNELGIDMPAETVAALRAMDNPGNLSQLAALGAAAAVRQVEARHFPPEFDLAGAAAAAPAR
jgi:uncharacterized protein